MTTTCTHPTTRDGTEHPCGDTAIALRFDGATGRLYPVCKAHARRKLAPLDTVRAVIIDDLEREGWTLTYDPERDQRLTPRQRAAIRGAEGGDQTGAKK